MPPKKKRKRKKRGHYHRGEHVSSKSGVTYRYRSGWEEKMMVYLDASPEVESWTYEQTVIEYISNIRTKKVRRYFPDFYVRYSDGRQEVLEVKPSRRLRQLVVRKKVAAAETWCADRGITYRLITEVELKALGLL